MNISILGAGNIGGSLGKKWIESGNRVAFGVRDLGSPKAAAMKTYLDDQAAMTGVTQAIAAGEIILFATPWAAVAAIAAENAEALSGKIIIDATNNFGAPVVNNVDTIISRVPTAKVYRAFNALGWENFANPDYKGVAVDLFYCGADSADRTILEDLITEVGLRPVYVGGQEMLPVVDALGTLWVTLAFRRGWGRGVALKLIER